MDQDVTAKLAPQHAVMATIAACHGQSASSVVGSARATGTRSASSSESLNATASASVPWNFSEARCAASSIRSSARARCGAEPSAPLSSRCASALPTRKGPRCGWMSRAVDKAPDGPPVFPRTSEESGSRGRPSARSAAVRR